MGREQGRGGEGRTPKPMSIELMMPSNHLILCRPLLLLPSIFPSIRAGMSWRILCQEPTPPATWAPCPWCWYQGVKHLVSRKSPPSFLFVLNHPRAHMTTDESRSTQVAQMLSLPASTLGDNAGGLGGVRRKQCTRGLWGRPEPPETTARWQGAPLPTSCLGPVLFQGRPGPWGCCERQLGGDG